MADHRRIGNWGRWGADDERGALNLLTDQRVLEATRICQTGRMYQLGLPLQRSGVPNYVHRGPAQRLTLTNHTDEERLMAFGGQPGVGANEDVIVMASHAVTHIDALSHVYSGGTLYNDHPQSGMTSYDGAARCGIEKAGAFVTRGVLLDVARHEGVPWLDPGRVIGVADLEACLEAQRVELRVGDAVLVRTGWLEWFFDQGSEQGIEAPQPGLGREAAVFLAEHDVVAVGSDNSAVEAMPFDGGEFLAVHVELLVRRGIQLIEHLRLSELSRDACRTFLLSVCPLLVTGASGSPVNPIAIA